MVAKSFVSFRVWLMLLCLANLDTASCDFSFELIQANFEFLHEQITQLNDFVRSNSEASLRLETKIAQISEEMKSNTETTKQQVELKITQLTEDMRRNSETTKQQLETKMVQLTELIETNAEATKNQVETKIAQLTEEIRNNSLSTKQQVEMKTSQLANAVEKNHLKISQLTELMEAKSEATKKQVEMKTSLLTNTVEKNHVSVLSQITQQQQKTTQLAEQMETNFNATKTVEMRLVNLTETISRNENLLNGIKNSTSDLLSFVPNPCIALKPNILCVSNSNGADWIVVQQRIDLYSTSFNRNWREYREGFGTIGESSSFWLGLERLYQLTKDKNYEMLVEVTNEAGEMRFARYSQFEIGSEAENYELVELSGFSGTEQDANSFGSGNVPTGQMFSTFDSDNDRCSSCNCASSYGGGWWWNSCGYSINYSGSNAKYASWYTWSSGSMKSTRMSIRERK